MTTDVAKRSPTDIKEISQSVAKRSITDIKEISHVATHSPTDIKRNQSRQEHFRYEAEGVKHKHGGGVWTDENALFGLDVTLTKWPGSSISSPLGAEAVAGDLKGAWTVWVIGVESNAQPAWPRSPF